jgi:hypothetical protein
LTSLHLWYDTTKYTWKGKRNGIRLQERIQGILYAGEETIELLYGIAFTIKMSKKGDHRIEGYFDYVVPPLERLYPHLGTEGRPFL